MNKSPGQYKHLFITLLIQRENFKNNTTLFTF